MHETLSKKSSADLIVVPLFETIEDLPNTAPIMQEFYALPGILDLVKLAGAEQDLCWATPPLTGMVELSLAIGSCIVQSLR